MTVIGFRTKAMPFPCFLLMTFLLELGMTQLVAHFCVNDFIVLNGKNEVVGRPAKVLADRLAVFCNCSDLH
jgi:hypothetical protein